MVATLEIVQPGLHDGQLAVDVSTARFKVVACGRRWGKTDYGVDKVIRIGLDGGFAWWVAPTFGIAMIGWDLVKHYAKQIPGTDIRQSEKLVTFPGGGKVQVKSTSDPDSLRGAGLDYVVMDEAAFCEERAWTEALRPTLSTSRGGALFISTPNGRNWFYRLWLRGNDPLIEDWESFHYPSVGNPFFDPEEAETARYELPETVYQQEYLAEFTEDGGLVFRHVRRQIAAYEHHPEHRHSAGLDWAQMNDFTVLAVIDDTTKQVAPLERFNQIDWDTQYSRVDSGCKRYGVSNGLAEINSIGSPGLEALQRLGVPMRAFTTTNESKTEIIQALARAFEWGEIWIPDDPVLIGELESFEATRLPSGKWKYEAPSGMHDDTVIALALAWWASYDSGRHGGIFA